MKEIHRGYDSLGPVLIKEDSNRRYLSFGADDAQSCIHKLTPQIPQYPFIRAMLLPLLYLEPKRTLAFGLGAGSLVHALHAGTPSLKQDVVELRQSVVDCAHRFFYLPRSKRMQIHVQDARDYLASEVDNRYDLIFSDLYTEEGAVELQMQSEFFTACKARLKPEGWLVINAWIDDRQADLLERLTWEFNYIATCTTTDGNWVVFATDKRPRISLPQSKERLRELNQRFGFSLGPFVKRLNPLI